MDTAPDPREAALVRGVLIGSPLDKLGSAPRITSDREEGTVTLFYEGERLGVEDWRGAHIYVTTWEHGPEGEYTEIYETASDWAFGGAPPDSPKVMDDLLVAVEEDQ